MDKPIDMILYCPLCGTQHIDKEETPAPHMMGKRWTNPPHRSHLCDCCGHIWRPADVPTNGVQAISTRGKDDKDAPAQIAHLVKVRTVKNQAFDDLTTLVESNGGCEILRRMDRKGFVVNSVTTSVTAHSIVDALRLAVN